MSKNKPISNFVRYVNPDSGLVDTAMISAFCLRCGDNRGKPKIVEISNRDGEPMLVHRWKNKCGHVDDDDTLHAEVELQCAGPGCVLVASTQHFPWCGEPCVVEAALNTINDLKAASASIDSVFVVAQAIMAMIDHPELEVPEGLDRGTATAIWSGTITKATDAAHRAQLNILEAIAHILNDHTKEAASRFR
jgi:hypothetical protein